MTPILFESNTTSYTGNGLGRLADCVTCLVTEERNGIYECEFSYPIDGDRYPDIEEGRVILVTHDERGDTQPFVIYRRSAPIHGLVTFYAHHISYQLSSVITAPFTATRIADAIVGLGSHAITNCPFTFWTDKTTQATFTVKVPTSARSLLGGMEGSILDVYGGGDYQFDMYNVRLYAHRGSDNGVTIRYGKNMTDLVYEKDVLDLYDAVVPYWSNDETTVTGGIVVGEGRSGSAVRAMDLSSQFENPPTADQLNARATTLLNNNKPWVPRVNIKVDFVSLWQTDEYKDFAPLERVRLCDTVTVYYEKLGVSVKAKVIKTVWNPLIDKYDYIEIGDAKTSFAETLEAATELKLQKVPTTTEMDKAIAHATELITGGAGGHIVFRYDDDGKPTEMFVMDTDDVTTAVNVLRINVNGIGFSQTGINGTYTSAWTLDGAFVANFITAGTLSADRIRGGTLELGGSSVGGGNLKVVNSSGDTVLLINENSLLSQQGDEIMQMIESILRGGYNGTWDGILDLSAQYENGVAGDATALRNVVLRAYYQHLILGVASGKRVLVETNHVPQGAVVMSAGANGYGTENDAIRLLYLNTANGTKYLGISPYSGTTYFAVLTTSDEKLKTNIQPAEDIGLETINKIEHKSFDFIDGGYHRDCGYIAQQLRDVIPYSTFSAPENDENGNQIGETLQLNDHEILVYATKAIQELSAKVAELERKLEG